MTPGIYQFPPFRLDSVDQCLWRGTEQVSLSPKAFSVLLYLVQRPGRLVTKQELLDAVWADIHVTEGVLKRAVLEVRKALGDPVEEPMFIQTLHRRGYRFLAGSAQPQAASESAAEAPGIVGRAAELDQLASWFDEAMESSRQVVFISGEAGMGKTTLIETWIRALGARAKAARGRCLQQFGSGEPYLPIFEALEQIGQALGRRLVEHLRSRAPTWLMHMPALISLEDRVKLRDEVFGSTQHRMLREIIDAFESLTTDTPLVLALEDLHWSDPSTIHLLSAIARRTTPARLMILATYRPSDAGGTSGPLLAAQNELELHRQCKVMRLAYLSEEATRDYLGGRFPGMDSPDLAAALHRRTNGNPLYVSCLVDDLERAGKIDGDPRVISSLVPETLQQMFERQAAQLTRAEQELLEAAAAVGEVFSIAAVAGATSSDSADIELLCEEMVRRHIILKRGELVRFPDGAESAGYAFVHALCRDALYRRIPPGKRSRLHARLGQVSEHLYAADPKRVAGQLAGHFEIAGDPVKTIQYLQLAAESAAGRYSVEEASQYLERAFAIVDRLPEADRPTPRMDLLERRARVRLMVSDMAKSAADFRALTDEALAVGAPARATRALLESLSALLYVDYRHVAPALEEAAQTAAQDPMLTGLVDVHRAFFQMYFNGWTQSAADLLEAALPNLKDIPDLRSRARVTWIHSSTLCFGGEFVRAAEIGAKARQLAREAGSFYDYFVASMYLQWSLVYRGDLGEALRVAKEGRDLAARNGSRIPQHWFTVRESWVHLEAFDFSVLETYEQAALSPQSLATNNRPLFLWLGRVRMASGDHAGAWEAWKTVSEALETKSIAFQVACPLLYWQAESKWEQGDIEEAEALSRKLVSDSTEHHEFHHLALAHRLLAEIAIRREDLHAGAEAMSQAVAALARCESWNAEWRVHASAARLFAHLGRTVDAETSRRRGIEAADRIAQTLVGEPSLRQSFLDGVNHHFPAARTNTA